MLATMTQRLLLLAAIVLVVGAVTLSITLVTRDGGRDEGRNDVTDIDAVLTREAGSISPSEEAERDDSPDLPGIFAPSQGRGHFSYTYSPDRAPTPFCDGVPWSGAVTPQPGAIPTMTPQPDATPPQDCYASNPPTSGPHLNIQINVMLANGFVFPRIPPDPGVYPPEAEMPRDAIPHLLEHAVLFVGYHCADNDAACQSVVNRLEDIVNDRIDNNNDRVVMARDSDLLPGTIGLASWTRVDTFAYRDFTKDRVAEFIDVHSCRYDPEGFCD